MNLLFKRFLLFLCGCIPLRLALVYAAKTATLDILRLLGFIALVPAIGFAYIYLTGSRPTGPEVFGSNIWWNSLRPVHSFLYFLFAYLAITGRKDVAFYALLVDALIGLAIFLVYHGLNGDFEKI